MSPDSIDPPNQPDGSVLFSYYTGRRENNERFWWHHILFFFKLGRPVLGSPLFFKTPTMYDLHAEATFPACSPSLLGSWLACGVTRHQLLPNNHSLPTAHTLVEGMLSPRHSDSPRSETSGQSKVLSFLFFALPSLPSCLFTRSMLLSCFQTHEIYGAHTLHGVTWFSSQGNSWL